MVKTEPGKFPPPTCTPPPNFLCPQGPCWRLQPTEDRARWGPAGQKYGGQTQVSRIPASLPAPHGLAPPCPTPSPWPQWLRAAAPPIGLPQAGSPTALGPQLTTKDSQNWDSKRSARARWAASKCSIKREPVIKCPGQGAGALTAISPSGVSHGKGNRALSAHQAILGNRAD